MSFFSINLFGFTIITNKSDTIYNSKWDNSKKIKPNNTDTIKSVIFKLDKGEEFGNSGTIDFSAEQKQVKFCDLFKNIESLTFENGILDDGVFSALNRLTDIHLCNVEKIKTNAFSNCGGIKNVYVEGTNTICELSAFPHEIVGQNNAPITTLHYDGEINNYFSSPELDKRENWYNGSYSNDGMKAENGWEQFIYIVPFNDKYEIKLYRSYRKTSFNEDINFRNTLYLPFAVRLPEGIKALIVKNTPNFNAEGEITTEELNLGSDRILKAYTPCLLYKENNDDACALNMTIECDVVVDSEYKYKSSKDESNLLKGSLKNDAVIENSYIIGYKNDLEGEYHAFWKSWDGKVLKWRSYYIPVKGDANSKVFIFGKILSENTVTDIKRIQNKSNDIVFNLNGIRIKNPNKGIYIKNNKKFISR